jgi:hypothetical protein
MYQSAVRPLLVLEAAHPRFGRCCAPGQVDAGRFSRNTSSFELIRAVHIESRYDTPTGRAEVAAMEPPAGSVDHMTLQYPAAPVRQRVTIGAGTALKIGFFGALGVLLLGMIVSAILAIVAVALGAAGYVSYLRDLQF